MAEGDILDKKKKQSIIVRNLFALTVFVIVMVSLAVVTVNALISMQSRGQLYDCTTPGGQCYQDAKDRADARTEKLSDIVVFAVTCSEESAIRNETDKMERVRKMSTCVNEQMLKEEG